MTDALTVLTLGTDTVAVVPAHALSWHRVQLPAGSLRTPRLRAVLEGLLEDLLLDEPSQLHFALQPNPVNSAPVWVAVCNKAWLRDALKALEATGTAVRRVVPQWAPDMAPTDTATDTAAPETLWITGSESAAHMVWADTAGVHQLPLHADTPLPPWLPWLASPQAHAQVKLLAEPAVARLAEQLFHRPATVVTAQESLAAAANATQWDLAQFDLALRNPLLNRAASLVAAFIGSPQWRPARWAVVALVVAQLVGLNAYAWRANTLLADQRKDIRTTFTTTFPKVAVVVDAPAQMQRELDLLRQSAGNASRRDLESLLAAYASVGSLGAISPAAPAESAQATIEFIANELRVSANAPDADALASVQGTLQPQGYSARLDGNVLIISAGGTP